MKSLKALLAVAAVAVAAVSMAPEAQAQPGAQSWSNFVPNSVNSGNVASPYQLQGPLNVNVLPYFYAYGTFGYDIDVQGWGAGSDARQTAFNILHNQTFTTNYTGFNNPADSVSGQQIDTTLKQSATDANGNPYLGLAPIGPHPISTFNGMGGTVNPAQSGGNLQVVFDYVMNIGPEDVAGTYSSVPTIDFTF